MNGVLGSDWVVGPDSGSRGLVPTPSLLRPLPTLTPPPPEWVSVDVDIFRGRGGGLVHSGRLHGLGVPHSSSSFVKGTPPSRETSRDPLC